MSDPTTSPDTISAISSPVSADGPMQLDLLDGLTIDRSGPAPAPASRSLLPESKKALMTSATYGPSGETSSRSAGLQLSLESRLRARLTGSDLCEVTWKKWVTPWGQSLFKPRARVRTISETDTGLWRTASATDAQRGVHPNPTKKAGQHSLNNQVSAWPTPTTRDHKDGPYCPNVPVNGLLGRMVWPTPTSLSPAKDGNNEAGNSAGLVAIRKHAMATWPTPCAMDPESDPQVVIDRKKRLSESTGVYRGPALPLGSMVRTEAAFHGSSEQTEKPGALNPEFVCWLMGYPEEWVSCGASATPSTRARRAK
jgi:hypothetical protein